MEIFRRNSKFYELVVMNGDEINVYLGYNIVGTASLTKELTATSAFVIGSKHCVNKAILWPGI
jgi:hypothetical protein